MSHPNRFQQEELFSEDLNSEKEVANFVISRNGGKITLSCLVTRRWENIFLLVLKCGNKQEHKITRRKGIARTERQALETTMKGSVGIGVAEFESEVNARIEREVQFEESVEVENNFPFEAPQCGRLTAALFQCTLIYHLTYQDDRWWHKQAWSKRIVEWLPIIRDESRKSLNDPDCNCAPERKDGFAGLLRVIGPNFSMLEGYTSADDQHAILNALKGEISLANVFGAQLKNATFSLEKPIPRHLIPPYLLFLSGASDESFAMRVGAYSPPKPFAVELRSTQDQILESLVRIESGLRKMTTPTKTREEEIMFGPSKLGKISLGDLMKKEGKIEIAGSSESEVAS